MTFKLEINCDNAAFDGDRHIPASQAPPLADLERRNGNNPMVAIRALEG